MYTKVPMHIIDLMETVSIFGKMVIFIKDNSAGVICKAKEDGGPEREMNM